MSKSPPKRRKIPSLVTPKSSVEEETSIIKPIETVDQSILIQPENMEVHKHPHHVMHGKVWSEYLLEFTMLFLAVFLGFLAEYMLEHRIEKERELTFINSFYDDLTSDEQTLPRLVTNLTLQINAADSLQFLLPNASTTLPGNLIYFYSRRLIRSQTINLYVNDRTNIQLRNSGGMRLIQNKQVSDSIVAYYKTVDQIQFLYDHLVIYKETLREAFVPLLKGEDYQKVINATDRLVNPNEILYLRSSDSKAINSTLLAISDIKGLSSAIKRQIINLQHRAGKIKKFIAREYNF